MYYLIYDPINFDYIIVNPKNNRSSYDWYNSISKCFNLVTDGAHEWTYPDDQSESGMREWAEGYDWKLISTYDELPTKQSHPELFI